jgi:DNA-binding transcriptional LysR family regulator
MFEDLFSKGGLSLERLRSFMLMANAGSIAKAAPQDPTRQSQISRQIKELESFFGAELTQRRGKTLTLSPAGVRLTALIREQLQDLEDFRREQASAAKVFTIGSGGSTLEWLVMPHLPALSQLLGDAVLRTEMQRSKSLVESVREGRVDLAVLRHDAIPNASKANTLKLITLTFHLCVPRRLLKRGTRAEDLADTLLWAGLPFAAGRDGGQMDLAVREGMAAAGVEFRPRFECGSLLQAKQLVEQGACAAVLPRLGIANLSHHDVLVAPFKPLAHYGRALALHWNPRQMKRRGVEDRVLREVATELRRENP